MRRKLLIAAIALFPLSAYVGVQARMPGSTAGHPATRPAVVERTVSPTLQSFREVFAQVRSHHVDAASDAVLIEAAINGLMSALDPHSKFLTEQDFVALRERASGEFAGLGIRIAVEGGLIKVVSPIEGSPAARAGLLAGDFIMAAEGASLQGLTMQEASEKLRGALGAPITLTVQRGSTALLVTLTRGMVRTPSVLWETRGDVGVIRIKNFDRHAGRHVGDALRRIESSAGHRLAGYILDLRNNPGGLLHQGVLVADSFLEAGTIVSTRGRGGRELKRFKARPGDLARGRPVVVLVNGGSASASEIVAGALQDHGRAIVMGTRSYGKGSVQTVMPLKYGGGAIKVTTARYYTPSGRSIQATGIVPDIEVAAARLVDLGYAPRLNGGPAAPQPAGVAGPGWGEGPAGTDFQLDRALHLLSGLAVIGAGPGPEPMQIRHSVAHGR